MEPCADFWWPPYPCCLHCDVAPSGTPLKPLADPPLGPPLVVTRWEVWRRSLCHQSITERRKQQTAVRFFHIFGGRLCLESKIGDWFLTQKSSPKSTTSSDPVRLQWRLYGVCMTEKMKLPQPKLPQPWHSISNQWIKSHQNPLKLCFLMKGGSLSL